MPRDHIKYTSVWIALWIFLFFFFFSFAGCVCVCLHLSLGITIIIITFTICHIAEYISRFDGLVNQNACDCYCFNRSILSRPKETKKKMFFFVRFEFELMNNFIYCFLCFFFFFVSSLVACWYLPMIVYLCGCNSIR